MFPHFLCIGAQKAGTTWLYDNIVQHPGVWMTPVKEIFYFDRPTWLPLALQLCQPSNRGLRHHTFGAITRRFEKKPAPPPASAPAARKPAAPALRGSPRMSRAARARWHARFMFLPRTDRWYGSLFRPAPGQITGDINPYLARLDDATVARIHRLMPRARIVYLLRNPVERIWSQVGMSMREIGVDSLDALNRDGLRHALEEGCRAPLSDYIGNLQRWTRQFGTEQVFVGFFEQLKSDPRALLRGIYQHLGIAAGDDVIPASVGAKSNPGSGPSIPAEYLQLLSERFLPQLEALHGHFDNSYTAAWLEQARERVGSVR